MRYGISKSLEFFGSLPEFGDVAAGNNQMPAGSAAISAQSFAGPRHEPARICLRQPILLGFALAFGRGEERLRGFPIFQKVTQQIALDFVVLVTRQLDDVGRNSSVGHARFSRPLVNRQNRFARIGPVQQLLGYVADLFPWRFDGN